MINIFDSLINKFSPYEIEKVKIDPKIALELEKCLIDNHVAFELMKSAITTEERNILIEKYKNGALEYNSIMQFIISKYAPLKFLELNDPPTVTYNYQLQSVVFTLIENKDLKTIEAMKTVGLEFLKSYLKDCVFPRKENISGEKSQEASHEDRLQEIREEDWSPKQ